MTRYFAAIGVGVALFLAAAVPVSAAPFTVNLTATVVQSFGSYAGDLDPGVGLTADVSLSTTETDAFNAITTPSTEPGHEFTSFYEFSSPPFSWNGAAPSLGGPGFAADVLGIVVNDNLTISAADTGGLIADGTYDWIELLGSTTVDVCPTGFTCPPDPFSPGDGEEWTVAIFGGTDWFSDGSVIPDSLPADFTVVLVGVEFNANGEEIGVVLASVDSFETTLPIEEVTAIPAPASAALVGLAILACSIRRRR